MKKKLLIGTILPSIAALAVIGSGFSLWIFNDSSSVETTGSVGINVTKVLDITNSYFQFGNENGAYLSFDQTTEGANGINPKGNGLKWRAGTTGQEGYQYCFLILQDPTDPNSATAYDDSVNYTFTTTITLSEVLASYVKLSFDTEKDRTVHKWANGTWTDGKTNTDKSVTYTFSFDTKTIFASEDSEDIESTLKGGFWIFSFDFIIPTYQDGMEPTTLGESEKTEHSYLKLLNDVKNESISVTYEAKASIVAE